MSDLNDKLREIQEQLENLCKEYGIEFYSTFYIENDEVPNELALHVWYPSRGNC